MSHCDTCTHMSAGEILSRVFGLKEFRGFQREVIETVAAGGDALVLMPTGGGKSLCYQIPALMRGGVAVVVSPLIALMADQVAALDEVGVKAAFLNSLLTLEQALKVKRDLVDGNIDLLYVAPERLVNPDTIELLDNARLALFAIDEAHCVSMWGHDFRPEYGALSLLREHWPQVPRIALTATADRNTREEICERLLIDPKRFVASFDRPNIRYRVVEKQGNKDAVKQLIRFIHEEHEGECGVVYCLARKTTEWVAELLCNAGIEALAYHAGLPSEERMRRQTAFLREDGIVMVATIAFGMGIDKPDVRFVAHVDMPKSIENYFQETGRAGRDGLPSDAWMAYGLSDVVNQRRFIDASDGEDVYKRRSIAKLDAMLALAETVGCRRKLILQYFDEASDECGNCDNCLEPPRVLDMTVPAQKFVSCIYRAIKASGHGFGAGHIIDVLCGNKTERVLLFGHDALSTFGIGADIEPDQWRRLLRQLVVRGFVVIDADHMNALGLGDVQPLLKGGEKVFVRTAPAVSSRRKPNLQEESPLTEEQEQLFAELKAWRKDEAYRQARPPFLIFPDATLRAIVREMPADTEALRGISGIGEAKIEHYGEAVLAIVRAFAKS